MASASFEIRLCSDCGLRYPLVKGNPYGERCPRCLGQTALVLSRPLAIEDQSVPDLEISRQAGEHQIEAILDNIRSEWNVGSIFRTADAIGVRKLYLCGITPTPHEPKLRKTALGAEDFIPWEYHPNAILLARNLQAMGNCLCAIEQDERAVDIKDSQYSFFQNQRKGSTKPAILTLIMGNEVTGVDPGLMDACDNIIAIGMRGEKRSLNVAVAFGIAAYHLSLLAH